MGCFVRNAADRIFASFFDTEHGLISQGQEFGTERLEEVICDCGETGAEELVEEVVRQVREFTIGEPQSDDLTLVVVKRNL